MLQASLESKPEDLRPPNYLRLHGQKLHDRIAEVKASWNAKERELRKTIAQRRLEQLLQLFEANSST